MSGDVDLVCVLEMADMIIAFIAVVDEEPLSEEIQLEVVEALKKAGMTVPAHMAGISEEGVVKLTAGLSPVAGGLLQRSIERAGEAHRAKRMRATGAASAAAESTVGTPNAAVNPVLLRFREAPPPDEHDVRDEDPPSGHAAAKQLLAIYLITMKQGLIRFPAMYMNSMNFNLYSLPFRLPTLSP